jgi:hypothetical protein
MMIYKSWWVQLWDIRVMGYEFSLGNRTELPPDQVHMTDVPWTVE